MPIDLLGQFSSAMQNKNISIVEFAESSDFCNPPEAPVWMSDLTFKSIGDIQIGDKVMGWYRKENYATRVMCESEVLNVARKQSPIIKVTMESGRVFRCTPDHLWLTASFSSQDRGQNGEWFGTPIVGRKLVHIIDVPKKLSKEDQKKAYWLGGIFDGEGSAGSNYMGIAQSPTYNPEVYAEIKSVLTKLGFDFNETDRSFYLRISKEKRTIGVNHAYKQMITNFVNWCDPVKKDKIAQRAMTRMSRLSDKIIKIEPDGYGEVIALTTSTGNYVANGYASKNCNKPLYPRQRVLLKLIFLEEMEGWEEDILSEWIRNPYSELAISPNIRERRQRLRDEGYPHFREVVLVGGRRASKGHITGLAIAKKFWDLTTLRNPQEHYGIDKDKQIYCTIIAASEDQAKKYQFADAKGSIMSCTSMQPYIDRVLNTEIHVRTPNDNARQAEMLGSKVSIPASLIAKASAANASTIRGEATIIAVLDEAAHMMEGVSSKSSAGEIYDAITPALDQFGIDALIFQNSSPYTKIGKFYENYCKAMNIDLDNGLELKEDIDYRMLSFQYPSWELYRDWGRDKRFRKALVLPPSESEAMALEEKKNPEKFAVERRAQFSELVEAYLNAEMVDRIFRPFNGRILKTRTDRKGFGPETTFKAHGDPATTDKNFGWAMGHIEIYEDEEGREQYHVFFDQIHAWIPSEQENHTINYLDIQDEIFHYISHFRPQDVSFDQFQSNALINYLRREASKHQMSANIREIVATEKVNLRRAEVFKTAINLGLVHAPLDNRYSELVRNELKFLQRKGNRIDHQTVGPVQTKDIADCMMTVVDHLIGQYVMPDLGTEMAKGALGGYGNEQKRQFSDMWYGSNRLTGMNRARGSRVAREDPRIARLFKSR